jgi:NitT/TauT family transport system substrate-binding protein
MTCRGRLWLRALWLALLLVTSRAAMADDVLHVGKAVPPDFGFTIVNVGLAAGTFTKHGLQVEAIDFGGAPKLHQAMLAGSVDIGLSGGPDLAFIAKGAPELGVAVLANEPRGLGVYARDDSGIKTVADLKGRKIGISAQGALSDWLMRQLMRQQGWTQDTATIIPLGAPTAIAAALRTGQIDAMFIDLTLAAQLDREHVGALLVNFGDVVRNFHIEVIYASLDIIKRNPDAVRRFLAGWFDTIVWMQGHKDETVQILAPLTHSEPAALVRIYETWMPTFSRDGRFDPKSLGVLAQSFVDLGLLDTAPDMTKLYTEAFLPARAAAH